MNKKTKGQVFTPPKIVNIILDNVNYKDKNLLNKKILEPSFGEGVFLNEIITRIILYMKNNNYSNDQIKEQIVNNVYGIELDEILYNKTVKILNELLESFGLFNVKLNLYNENALKFNKEKDFDFIVGNPPYVRIHNIDDETRKDLNNFTFSKGNTDLYIVFFEYCINILNKNGKLGFITPNSYLKNTSQKDFRNYLINNKLIYKIVDYRSNKVFDDADTYACITFLDKKYNKNKLKYIYSDFNDEIFDVEINIEEYKNKIWTFNNSSDNIFLNEIKNRAHSFSEYGKAQYGLATNADKVFIGKIKDKSEDTVLFNNYEIEKDILIDVIKGGKYNGTNQGLKLVFPYEYKGKKYVPITEDDLKKKYPLAYKYLLANKEKLESRDLEKSTPWYAFARSQGLSGIDKEKVIFKTTISKDKVKLEAYKINKNTAIYSGIYITGKINEIKKIIETKDFCKYCILTGKDMSGDYVSISSKTINTYKY